MRGNGHDGAGAVAPQNVVGNEDRNRAAVDRIDAEQAGKHAGLGAFFVSTLRLGLRGGLGAVRAHGLLRRGGAPVHASFVPSGQEAGRVRAASSSASPPTVPPRIGCSGATTMKVAPNSVSGRVV